MICLVIQTLWKHGIEGFHRSAIAMHIDFYHLHGVRP